MADVITADPELICGECPLEDCDEGSLWCLYRFVTAPNERQQPLVGIHRRQRERLFNAAQYREDHREHKRQYDRERYSRKIREQATAT